MCARTFFLPMYLISHTFFLCNKIILTTLKKKGLHERSNECVASLNWYSFKFDSGFVLSLTHDIVVGDRVSSYFLTQPQMLQSLLVARLRTFSLSLSPPVYRPARTRSLFFNYVEENFYCCAVIFFSFCSFVQSWDSLAENMQSRNIFLLLLLVIKISLTSTSEHQHVVCDTVEVRSYKELMKLTNCTIVVGNLAVMIGFDGATENFTKEDIKSRSFPLRYTRAWHLVIFQVVKQH